MHDENPLPLFAVLAGMLIWAAATLAVVGGNAVRVQVRRIGSRLLRRRPRAPPKCLRIREV